MRSTRSRAVHPRKAQVVELRFFSGLVADEIAEVLGVSTYTVTRDWTFARTWLKAELSERQPNNHAQKPPRRG